MINKLSSFFKSVYNFITGLSVFNKFENIDNYVSITEDKEKNIYSYIIKNPYETTNPYQPQKFEMLCLNVFSKILHTFKNKDKIYTIHSKALVSYNGKAFVVHTKKFILYNNDGHTHQELVENLYRTIMEVFEIYNIDTVLTISCSIREYDNNKIRN